MGAETFHSRMIQSVNNLCVYLKCAHTEVLLYVYSVQRNFDPTLLFSLVCVAQSSLRECLKGIQSTHNNKINKPLNCYECSFESKL